MPDNQEIFVSVILPCRNEQESLDACLTQIKSVLARENLAGEIIVSDSSSDLSPEIAQRHGVVLVKHDQIGYGRAYLEGFKAARGRYLFLADADGTYDFKELPRFLAALAAGADLVLGDRFARPAIAGSMPWLNRHIGNPALSGILRRLFSIEVNDSHSGMRALKRETALALKLTAEGMEFASEMIIKAGRAGLTIRELPIDYHPRRGASKLRPLVDGWRHLHLMLSQARNKKSDA